jgi:membrane-associated phospholipid phosphatase
VIRASAFFLIAAAAVCARPLHAQTTSDTCHAARGDTAAWPVDSSSRSAVTSPLVTRRSLLALGAAALVTLALEPVDARLQAVSQSPALQDNRTLQRGASALAFAGGGGPFVAGGLLFLAGRATHATGIADLGLHLTEGVTLAATLGALGKGVSGRALPNAVTAEPGDFSLGRGFRRGNGPFVSVPSGHTAAAFASAAVLTSEAARWRPPLRWIVGPLAYSGATLVGFARVYQNVHWVSDLPIAAVIGTWSGLTVVRRQHNQSAHPIDRWLLGTSIAPSTAGGVVIRWSSLGLDAH